MHEFVAGTKIEAEKVNENFEEQGALIDAVEAEVDALQLAPPVHASRHAPGGADPLYKTGQVSFTTGGSGQGQQTAAHGLGAAPSIAIVSGSQDARITWDATNVTVIVEGGAAFTLYTLTWIVFR